MLSQCWESWSDLFLNAVESIMPKIKLKDARSRDPQIGLMVKLLNYLGRIDGYLNKQKV